MLEKASAEKGEDCLAALSRRHAVVLAAFFASGAAGLIYESCWIRRATAIFGATPFAVATSFAPREGSSRTA